LFVKACTYCDFTEPVEKGALQFSDGVLYEIWRFHSGQNFGFGLLGYDHNLKVFCDSILSFSVISIIESMFFISKASGYYSFISINFCY
jgi:hypothetical protein